MVIIRDALMSSSLEITDILLEFFMGAFWEFDLRLKLSFYYYITLKINETGIFIFLMQEQKTAHDKG